MKRILSITSTTLVLLFSIQFALAQSSPVIKLSAPGEHKINKDIKLIIQLEESNGASFDTGVLPDITFNPSENIKDDVLYDCETEDSDNCSSNNRNTAGIFESLFKATQFPVTVTVKLNGQEKSLEINGTTAAAPANAKSTTNQPASTTASASTTSTQTVQVGVSPAWSLMILIALIGMGFSYFVLSINKE